MDKWTSTSSLEIQIETNIFKNFFNIFIANYFIYFIFEGPKSKMAVKKKNAFSKIIYYNKPNMS